MPRLRHRAALASVVGGLLGGLIGAGVMSAGHALITTIAGDGAAASVWPAVAVGAGTGFGAAVWLGAHATVVPALGLAPSPLREPPGKEARELILHLATASRWRSCGRPRSGLPDEGHGAGPAAP